LATSPDAEIAEAIAEAARTLPSAQLRALADALEQWASAETAKASGVAGVVLTPAFTARAAHLMSAWGRQQGLNGAAIATALRAAGLAAAGERELEHVEVVWTGPAPPGVPVRLTSAVIADVAAGARSNLLLMSYAAYKVPAVVAAIEAACKRGVVVDLVLESGAASGGKLRFDAFKAFGDVAENVRLWEWPLDRRPQLEKGHAVLHAKAALADEDTAFVTSANLTGLGLDENIELGLLVRGGPTPQRIARYVRGLMAEGVLARA
jgi:phosphatidylserine/phosphatidylglycerophosphate/cardiolipin synthase-like enzyme